MTIMLMAIHTRHMTTATAPTSPRPRPVSALVIDEILAWSARRRISRRELARRVGIGYISLLDRINGHIDMEVDLLIRIARVLDVSTDVFFPVIEIDRPKRITVTIDELIDLAAALDRPVAELIPRQVGDNTGGYSLVVRPGDHRPPNRPMRARPDGSRRPVSRV